MKTVRQLLERKGYGVETIEPAAAVYQALARMAEVNVGALVVVEGGEIRGLISERDSARKVVLKGRVSRETPVSEIMTRDIVCVEPSQPVEVCMALMTEKRVRHLPVLEAGRLIGIVSIGDLVKAIMDEQQFTIQQLELYVRNER